MISLQSKFSRIAIGGGATADGFRSAIKLAQIA
jgi:hypothetical protein